MNLKSMIFLKIKKKVKTVHYSIAKFAACAKKLENKIIILLLKSSTLNFP